MIHIVRFDIATNGSGAYDSSSDGGVTGQPFHVSKLLAVRWVDGDLTDGVDGVLSVVQGDSTITLGTFTNANDDAMYYPRSLVAVSAGTAATDAYTEHIVDGTLKLVVSSGGASKSGKCLVYLDDFS